MITCVMQGDVLLHVAVAEIPQEYFNPVFDRDPDCELTFYRYSAGSDAWWHCDHKTGLNFTSIQHEQVPAAARLAATIGG